MTPTIYDIAKRCQVDGPLTWAEVIIATEADRLSRQYGISVTEAAAQIRETLDRMTYAGDRK